MSWPVVDVCLGLCVYVSVDGHDMYCIAYVRGYIAVYLQFLLLLLLLVLPLLLLHLARLND